MTTQPVLENVSFVQARHLGYGFLSRLFLDGLTTESFAQAAALPDLAVHLPSPVDFDELASGHYQLFDFNVHPFESIFLAENRLVGGEVANQVFRHYKQTGFDVLAGTVPSDHVGQELAYLAYLCGQELVALKTDGERVKQFQAYQRQFMDNHILRWFVPLQLAIKQQGDGFFTAVAEVTLALLSHHYQQIPFLTEPFAPTQMPSLPNLLDNEKTGFKELAAYLLTPVYSGLYVSRDDVSRLARQLNLPRGFGNVQQMLTNLLHTAVQYEQFSELWAALTAMVNRWQFAYQALVEEQPLLKRWVTEWQEKIQKTLTLLEVLDIETTNLLITET